MANLGGVLQIAPVIRLRWWLSMGLPRIGVFVGLALRQMGHKRKI